MSDLLAQLPLAVGTVRCGQAHHQLIWEHGELRAPAHPDPDAELALVALGAEPCRCVELLGFWRACVDDPRALILGPRERTLASEGSIPPRAAIRRWPGSRQRNPGPNPSTVPAAGASTVASLSMSSMSVSQRSVRIVSAGAGPPREPPGEDPLIAVLQISDRLSRRLVATVAATLIEAADPSQLPLLEAALYGRVLAGLTRWLGSQPPLDLEVVEPTAARTLSRHADTYHAALPLGWLTEVWAPELTLTDDGEFVLAAGPLRPEGRELTAVDRELAVRTRTHRG